MIMHSIINKTVKIINKNIDSYSDQTFCKNIDIIFNKLAEFHSTNPDSNNIKAYDYCLLNILSFFLSRVKIFVYFSQSLQQAKTAFKTILIKTHKSLNLYLSVLIIYCLSSN